MKAKYIIIGIIALILLIIPSLVNADEYGEITCNYIPIWGGAWLCSDGFMWFNYESMSVHYSPPMEEIYIPESTYLYVEGGSTETLSGN